MHIREVLLFCFNWKKSAAEAHRLLQEVYGEHAPAERTCRKWFKRFKDGDFDTADQERHGATKKFEDEELETLLDQDPCQTLEELAIPLNLTQAAVSIRLKSIGMVQKKGKWLKGETTEFLLERDS